MPNHLLIDMKNKLFKQRKLHHRNIVFYVLLFMISFTYAQVSVGNTDPQATLDITASNQTAPSNEDGILIPRVDDFPVTNPTVAQQGMLIYLTTTVGLNSKGFYHWDQMTTSWIRLTSIEKLNDLSDGKSDVDGSEDGSSIFIGIGAGLVDDSSDNQNVGIGFGSLQANTGGQNNAALGYETLRDNTGNNNSAFGWYALRVNTNGVGNSAFGKRALEDNQTADQNTAIGADVLRDNTLGAQNTAVGNGAMFTNTIGNYNVAIGNQALYDNLSGDENVAIGNLALYDNITGGGNTAVGTEALTNNTATAAAGSNTAVGYHALHLNEDGINNTGVGYEALNNNITSTNNTAFGHGALKENISGNNTAIGSLAGELIANDDTASGSNVIIGHLAGNELDGSNNVIIGQQAGRYTIGNQNVFLGKTAGRDNLGNANVFIGYRAGLNSSFDNSDEILIIENSNTSVPLIYGDFANNRVGIDKIATTHALEVNGTTETTQYKLSALNTAPASATDTGIIGEIRVTTTHIYVCIAANTWVRSALATW
ncbi:MAG: hypothetical protein ABJL44_12615 [Algibacter sp.]